VNHFQPEYTDKTFKGTLINLRLVDFHEIHNFNFTKFRSKFQPKIYKLINYKWPKLHGVVKMKLDNFSSVSLPCYDYL
jgi:hypothetical protein